MSTASRHKIEDIEYWRSLNPQSSISENPFPSDVVPYEVSDDIGLHLEQLQSEAYFCTAPIVPREDRDKLIAIIRNVVDAGHLSTYALLYDDFYHVTAKLRKLMTPVLGEGYQLVPDELEAYWIETDDDETGSGPHRDSLRTPKSIRPDGLPALVNVWVALTDATPLNSCMYVLPAHLDPDFPKPSGSAAPSAEERHGIPLQDIRAVPARAGSVVCWSTSLLHWGARSSRFASGPRFSFAIYLQRGDVPRFHPAAMTMPNVIPFAYRLYLVEKDWRDPSGANLYKAQRSSGVDCE